MQKFFPILKRCPLFAQIGEEKLGALLTCLGARVLSYPKKAVILSEGDPARFIALALSGSVQLERTDFYGNRSLLVTLTAGELFGEAFACANLDAMPLSAVAAEECRVMLIDCQRILYACTNACDFHQQLIFNLLKLVAEKNIFLTQKAEITAKRTTREKLMAYLLQRAKQQNSPRFTIPYNRQELADFLGVDRSGLSAEISVLRKEGVLESRKNQFRLLT